VLGVERHAGVKGRTHILHVHFKLSVGIPGNAYLLEIEGLFTHGSRTGRTVGTSVAGICQMDTSDWSNGMRMRYHTFDTRPDTEFITDRLPFDSVKQGLKGRTDCARHVTRRHSSTTGLDG
jgi:hypothetical protein